MYLNKYNRLSKDKKEKYTITNLHPFTSFEVSKVKNDFLKHINNIKDKEKNYMTLFGIKSDNNKNVKINKIAKKTQKSLPSSPIISRLNEIFSLNPKKKNTLSPINQIYINFHVLPHIKRNIRKYRTNFAININNIDNVKFDNLLLNSVINKKKMTSKNIIHQSPFITDIQEITPNNSPLKQKKNKVKPKLKLNELLNENNEKNSLSNINSNFSLNTLTPININSQKALKFDSFSFNSFNNDKLILKSSSNKSLMNIKSLSSKNNPINNRYKSEENHPQKKLILNNINISRNKVKGNALPSLRNQDSSNTSAEIKSTSNNNDKPNFEDKIEQTDKIFANKKRKKVFNSLFKDKIFDLQNVIDKNSNAHEKTEEEYNLYIKYMIKKCKFIYNILDKNFKVKIPEEDYNIKRREMPKIVYSVMEENNNKKRKAELELLMFQIRRNINKINYLVNRNNNINRRVNSNIEKFMEKSSKTN